MRNSPLLTRCLVLIMLSSIGINFLPPTAYGQARRPMITRFNTALKKANAVFVMPEGFKELDSGKDYVCREFAFISPMVYTIVNNDSTVRIGFAAVFPPGKGRFGALAPDYSPEKLHLQSAESAADASGVKHYESDYVERKFNADDGGEFFRNCIGLYERIYPHNRVVFIHKANRGYFEINYIYTDKSSSEEIDSLVSRTAGMLRYLD